MGESGAVASSGILDIGDRELHRVENMKRSAEEEQQDMEGRSQAKKVANMKGGEVGDQW